MRPDKAMTQLMRMVEELKRRRIFVSMVMTTRGTQLSWWDAGLHKIVTSDQYGAAMHLNALRENDRRELEYVGRRMGSVV